jgi:hypothetical protein
MTVKYVFIRIDPSSEFAKENPWLLQKEWRAWITGRGDYCISDEWLPASVATVLLSPSIITEVRDANP